MTRMTVRQFQRFEFVCLLGALLLAAWTSSPEPSPQAVTYARRPYAKQEIRVGQTREDVLRVLGPPHKTFWISCSDDYDSWYLPDGRFMTAAIRLDGVIASLSLHDSGGERAKVDTIKLAGDAAESWVATVRFVAPLAELQRQELQHRIYSVNRL